VRGDLRPATGSGHERRVRRPTTVPGWVILSLVVVVGAHVVAGAATAATISLMGGASEFAQTVRENDLTWLPLWRSHRRSWF